MTRIPFLLLTTSAYILVSPTGVLAQTIAPVSADRPAANDDSGSLSDIVVTAQRRRERLQDVPVTVAVISADRLANTGVENMQDLGQLVPSLSVSSAIGQAITYLRGVGNSSGFPGLETPISIYIDGVYIASAQSSLFDLNNIERIEVLKGPQGTLFGRNATGGLIQAFTRDPTAQFHADGHIGYGNYQTLRGDGYVSGAIAENLAADISFMGDESGKGYGTNLTDGHNINRNLHNVSVRSKWIYTPSPDAKITLIGDYTDQNGTMGQPRIMAGTLLLGGRYSRGGPYDIDVNGDPVVANRNYGVSLKLEQGLGFAGLSNLIAYREAGSRFKFDGDFSPIPIVGGDAHDSEHQFSDELQLSSLSSSALKWTLGVYYFNAWAAYDSVALDFGQNGTNDLFEFYAQKTESLAGYAQATYEFLPATNITGGIRYTHEHRTIGGVTAFSPSPIGGIPVVPQGVSFDKPTFRVAIDHRFSNELFIYALFNTGFKSGGFNTNTPMDPPFLPETVTAYEGGAKLDLLGRKLRLNVAGFYYDYKNIQVQKTGFISVGIINGAAARDWGLEADLEAAVTRHFHVTGSAGYTNAKYTDFTNAPTSVPLGNVPVFAGDATGHTFPKAPKFQGILTADYTFDLSNGTLRATGSWAYNSGYFLQPDNVTRQTAFSKFNASLYWQSPSQHVNVRAWVTNLSNKATIGYGNSAVSGQHYVNIEPPRLYGMTLGFKY